MPPAESHSHSELERDLASDGLEFRMFESSAITDEMARELVAHFRATFPSWPPWHPDVAPLDYLRWKMSCPATDLGSFQGRLDGRLVYATTVFASWMRIGGARRRRLSMVDASVDPAARGRRVFSRAVAYQDTMRYECDFSMHERSVAAEVRQRLGHRDQRPIANRVRMLSRILDPRDASAPFSPGFRRLIAVPASVAYWSLGALMTSIRPIAPAPLRTVHQFDHRFDQLFEAVASSFDMIAERTAEFLAWRYGDPRGGRHLVRELTDGDRLIGYAVVRTVERRAYLADLLVLPGQPRAIEALVADAVEIARRSGASVINCWLPHRHPYRRVLRRQGFFDRGRDAGVSYHPMHLEAADLALLADPRARIHYMLGDTDLV